MLDFRNLQLLTVNFGTECLVLLFVSCYILGGEQAAQLGILNMLE